MAARRWTTEQRKAQAARIRQTQPWRHATGPTSAAGKAKVARNADRGGVRVKLRELSREVRRLLAQAAQALRDNDGTV